MRLTLGLTSVDEKSNEIPAVQELLKVLDLEGAVVTADAMHCQKETAKAVIKKDADYVLVVKGNQPTLQDELHQAIIAAFYSDDPAMRRHYKKEINRGRIEQRDLNVLPCLQNSSMCSGWEGISTIGTIGRSREIGGVLEESSETFITSLPCKVLDVTKRMRDQ